MSKLFTILISFRGTKLAFFIATSAAISVASALADPPGAIPPSPCTGGNDPFAEVKEKVQNANPDQKCQHNINAQHEKELEFPCQRLWNKVVERIKEYEDLKKSKCAMITKVANNPGGGCESRGGTSAAATSGQKHCLLNLANQLDLAAKSEKELAAAVETAKTEVSELVSKAETAAEKYTQDQSRIVAAEGKSWAKTAYLKAKKQYYAAVSDTATVAQIEQEEAAEAQLRDSASGVSGVTLQKEMNGEVLGRFSGKNNDTVIGYRQKIAPLRTEQLQAADVGKSFSQSAESTISAHNKNANNWAKAAADAQARANSLGTSRDPGVQTGGGSTNISGGSNMNNGTVGDSQPPAGTPQSNPSQSGMPMAGAAPAPAGGSAGYPSDSLGTLDPGASLGGNSSNNSTNLGGSSQTGSAKKEDPYNYGGKTDFAGLPEGTVAQTTGSLGASSSKSEEAGLPVNKGGEPIAARGIDGGGSSKLGASAGAGSGNSKEKFQAQNLKGFETNLNSGGTGILGSEVASALDDLTGELGLEASNGLTAEENAAFASLDENSADRSLASLDETDASVGESDSQPLFFRTREAHTRAIKRGNLMVTVKTRL